MINIKKLDFSYSQTNYILEDVNIKIEPGKIYGLIGNNGSGKTTLMRIIMNYLNVKKGIVEISENKKVIYIPAEIAFPKMISHKKLIKHTMLLQNNDIKQCVKNIHKYYSMLGIKDIPDSKPISSFSSGMQKKIALGLVLANDYDIYLFDEPTILIDISTKKDFFNVVKELVKKGKTIIISSHVLKELESHVDNFIIIKDKKVKLIKNTEKSRKEIDKKW